MMKSTFKKIMITILALFLYEGVAFAKPIHLYEQPKADSKTVGTIDPSVGVITIFTPKDGTWVKVADPRDGKVGWVKADELANTTVKMNMTTTGNGVQSYQVFQFGNEKTTYSPAELENYLKQLQNRQKALQKEAQQLFQQNMPKGMPQPPANLQMIMPIMVIPANVLPPTQQNSPQTPATVNKK